MFLIDSLFDEHDLLQALRYWDVISMNHSPFHISSHSWLIYCGLSLKNVYMKKTALEEERH